MRKTVDIITIKNNTKTHREHGRMRKALGEGGRNASKHLEEEGAVFSIVDLCRRRL